MITLLLFRLIQKIRGDNKLKQVLKTEYSKLFKNKITYIVFFINTFIIFLQVITQSVPYWNANKIMQNVYPLGVFEKWIGGEAYSIYPELYFFIAPLLSSIPYGASLAEELKIGYIRNVCVKIKKEQYFLAKYIVAFTTGLITVIPLMINFILTAMIFPTIMPQRSGGFYMVTSNAMFGDLFYVHPFLYLIIYVILNILVWGFLATMSVIVSLKTKYAYVAMSAPFLIALILEGISLIPNLSGFGPMRYLKPSQFYSGNIWIVIAQIVVFIMLGIVYMYEVQKKEII